MAETRALPPFPVEFLDLPDDQLGAHLLAWWASYQAERLGFPPHRLTHDMLQKIRNATLGMDTDDAGQAALVKALHRVAGGDAAGGGKLFRDLMRKGAEHLVVVDEAATGRRKQRKIAKMPRSDGLQLLIEKIAGSNPKIKNPELLEKLRADNSGDVIDCIDDAEGNIEWHDNKNPAGSTPISGLKDRLSRAKKRMKSR